MSDYTYEPASDLVCDSDYTCDSEYQPAMVEVAHCQICGEYADSTYWVEGRCVPVYGSASAEGDRQ